MLDTGFPRADVENDFLRARLHQIPGHAASAWHRRQHCPTHCGSIGHDHLSHTQQPAQRRAVGTACSGPFTGPRLSPGPAADHRRYRLCRRSRRISRGPGSGQPRHGASAGAPISITRRQTVRAVGASRRCECDGSVQPLSDAQWRAANGRGFAGISQKCIKNDAHKRLICTRRGHRQTNTRAVNIRRVPGRGAHAKVSRPGSAAWSAAVPASPARAGDRSPIARRVRAGRCLRPAQVLRPLAVMTMRWRR